METVSIWIGYIIQVMITFPCIQNGLICVQITLCDLKALFLAWRPCSLPVSGSDSYVHFFYLLRICCIQSLQVAPIRNLTSKFEQNSISALVELGTRFPTKSAKGLYMRRRGYAALGSYMRLG